MKVKFRTVFWIAAAGLVAVLLALAFRPQPVAVDIARTSRGPMVVTVRDEGRTRVRNEYVVSAPVAGRLLRVELKPGARVHAGDVIARIVPGASAFLDPRSEAEARAAVDAAEAAVRAAESELDRAEAQVEFARTNLERTEDLRTQDLASAEDLDRARLELRLAEAAVRAAEQNVRLRGAELAAARSRLLQPGAANGAEAPAAGGSDASIAVSTPVSGRVLTVAQESESVIAAGAQIMSIGDPDDLEVVIEMLSTDAVEVEQGADVLIENFARGEEPLRGRVRLVEPFGFTKISALGVEEQRVNVIVDFVGPLEAREGLAHGYRVDGAVVTWQADDVLRAPVPALFRSDGRWALFRVENGAALLTPVEIGHDNGQFAEILSGIDADQTVVLYPGERITDGSRVRRRD